MAWLWTTISGASLGRPRGWGQLAGWGLESHEDLLTYMYDAWSGRLAVMGTYLGLFQTMGFGLITAWWLQASGSPTWQLRSPFASI